MVQAIHIISEEMIKPSSPTPHHLLDLKLSALKQIAPPFYLPTIFFYKHEQLMPNFSRAYVSQHLKKSLSDVLVLFYPIAGRMKSLHYITCNDEGVKFIESEIHTTLSRVLENSDMKELQRCLPMNPCNQKCLELIIAIQITYFDCGGIAIATCASHKVLDGQSFFMFMNSWAATSVGASNILTPNFGLAKHFPPTQSSSIFQMSITGTKKEKLLTKKFVFDKKMLMALKIASACGSQVKNPSRVEAITIFIWRLFLKKANVQNKKINYSLKHVVNIRPRMREDNLIGNLYKTSTITVRAEKYSDDLDIVSLMRESIKKVNKDTVKMLANRESYDDFLENIMERPQKEETECFNFSSLTTFPVYEMDFGWGKPVWVCITTLPFKNSVFLMSTRCGEGIEAWVNLCVEDMAMVDRAYNELLWPINK